MSTASLNRDIGRPRTFTDDSLFIATSSAIQECGYRGLSLAAIATRAGCSKATIVQRFSSRQGLLRAYLTWSAEKATAVFHDVRASAMSPLETVQRVLLETLSGNHYGYPVHTSHTHYLLFYLEGRNDPEFRDAIHTHAMSFEANIAELLDEAVQRHEIHPCDTRNLAHVIVAATSGSMLMWSPATGRNLQEDLKMVLDGILESLIRV